MKNKFLSLLAVISFTAIILSGCNKEEDDDDDDNNNGNPGYIFYRWDKESVCSSFTITNYSDDNSGVPANASRGTFYGPCEPGSYDGSFSAGSGYSPLDYTIESPPDGYNRYYTRILVGFHVQLNRCVTYPLSVPEQLTYYDEPCNGTCDDGGGGGGGGGCTDPYESPTPNDAQLNALCQAAYTYRCAGYDSQADLTCAQYSSLASTGTGVPDCPYCN